MILSLSTLAIWILGYIFSLGIASTLPLTTTNLLDGSITMHSPESETVDQKSNNW
jgi:hypothetical protein